MPRLAALYEQASHWATEDLWRFHLDREPMPKAIAYRWLRILILSIREFGTDKCGLRASALTFYSLLSIVPVVALAFGVAKGFGMDQMLESTLRERLPGQEEILDYVIQFSRNQLTQTRGGVVAGIGVGVLFWTVVRVLSNIESSLNAIWGVTKARTWVRKFSDYLAFVMIGPLIVVMASSLTVYVSSIIRNWTEEAALWGGISAPMLLALRLLPGTLIWLLFSFMYVFMPNTKVRIFSALIGGVVAGAAYQIAQAAYVNFQIGAAQFGAIYGSFAALPLFLIWMQASWLIVLFGAELAYAHQNVHHYEFRPDSENVSPAFRRLLALAIVRHCILAFCGSKPAPSAEDISQALDAPANLVNNLLEKLVNAEVLALVETGSPRYTGFLPATDVGHLSIAHVSILLDNDGKPDTSLAQSDEIEVISRAMTALEEEIRNAPANLPLGNL